MFEGLDLGQLTACIAGRWTPKIGDPSLAGWLTVADYLVCAVLSTLVVRISRPGIQRRFWMFLALVMLALAINKQMDLQSALTATGRCVAKMQGWYGERRSFQRHFIEGLLLVTVLGLAMGLYLMRRHLKRNGLALLGLAMVAGFVAVRAVGFHHFDTLIKQEFLDLRYNVWLENSGLILIALNSLLLLFLTRGSAHRSDGR